MSGASSLLGSLFAAKKKNLVNVSASNEPAINITDSDETAAPTKRASGGSNCGNGKKRSKDAAAGASKKAKTVQATTKGKINEGLIDSHPTAQEESKAVLPLLTFRSALAQLAGPPGSILAKPVRDAFLQALPLPAEASQLVAEPLSASTKSLIEGLLLTLSRAVDIDSRMDKISELEKQLRSCEKELEKKRGELVTVRDALKVAKKELEEVKTTSEMEKTELKAALEKAQGELRDWEKVGANVVDKVVDYGQRVFNACREKAPSLTIDILLAVDDPDFDK